MAAAVMQMESPVGRLTLVASAGQLSGVFWESERERVPSVPDGHMPQPQDVALLRQAGVQLDEYFAGRRTRFDLPLVMAGTPFQEAVWRALLDIPYGEVRSYGDLAWKIGRPSAARAVGAANGRNPLSIIVPCHRVVGQDGTLTGFAGGLSAKHRLLRLEGHWLDSAETAQARLLTGPVAAQLELGI